ncbi:MAG TPA: hypothetical protein PLJ13_14405 [Cyclobacteriaceae bacterium]|nr:hypothetical protein [Cyclobacteriaceae bacterium]HRG78181.1 hypothetical protein [Cyclobacteriaceae bacterium]
MKVIASFLLVISFCGVLSVNAQSLAGNSTEVVFDPLFWERDLKLSRKQYGEILEINVEFYNSVNQTLHRESAGHPNLMEMVKKRSDLIWGVFSSRQKFKWRKIFETT